MSLTSRPLVSLCIAAGLAFAVPAQEKPSQEGPKKNLTARELFYAAVQTISTTPKTDAAKAAAKPGPRPPKAASRPVEAASNGDQHLAVSHGSLSDGGQMIRSSSNPSKAGAANSAGTPLGLRYTVLKVAGSNMVEVAPDAVFHAGDRIQLRVESNTPGYLYIISQGSSGTWKPIFPSPEIENGNNRVEGLHAYTLPSEEHRMVFDEIAGAEKLFVILSRQPEPDLEKMIYSLRDKPAAEKSGEQPEISRKLIMAANSNIDNGTVGRMRNAYSRDLIIEKVTPASPGEKKETAVYVVNPTGSSSSRVVADLSLVHQ